MKFRLLEKENGTTFVIQCKRKFWPFWYCAKDYGDNIGMHIGQINYPCINAFKYEYGNHKDAKLEFDRIVQYHLEYSKRKRSKSRIMEEIDLNKTDERFVQTL